MKRITAITIQKTITVQKVPEEEGSEDTESDCEELRGRKSFEKKKLETKRGQIVNQSFDSILISISH